MQEATAETISAENSMPVLAQRTRIASSTVSIWLTTPPAGIASIRATFFGFWLVTAVIAVQP